MTSYSDLVSGVLNTQVFQYFVLNKLEAVLMFIKDWKYKARYNIQNWNLF